jgi:hypothetical protein
MSTELTISQKDVENRIFTLRGMHVMLDSDLAVMYQTETKFINRAVKRNPDRFPENFMFQLSTDEWERLRFQFGTSGSYGGRRYLPFVFTEQGVAMLSAVLKTTIAIKVSIQIINAFVQMRKHIANHSGLLQRMDNIEKKQLETDQKFEKVLIALENKDATPSQGLFFDGQVFDAYQIASKIIRTAQQNIVLIDNYIDEITLTHLAKKNKGVKVLILTRSFGKQLILDINKANEQYGGFEAKIFNLSHDRFLIIDNTELYHLGASLKDIGKKWFAFSKMDKVSVANIIDSLSNLM